MKTIVYIVFALLFVKHANAQPPSQVLQYPKSRATIFDAILSEHELIKEFLNRADGNDHALMMISQMDKKQEMDHANCPMVKSSNEKNSESPYKGNEVRVIKALSPEDVEKYRKGEGMGLAMPAELNHYPGPKHVLDLADKLGLREEQRKKTQQAFDKMHARATVLGEQIVTKEEVLDKLFASGNIDEKGMQETTADIAKLQGELRAVHLQAHLTTRAILTSEQRATYDKLRGYGSGNVHKH